MKIVLLIALIYILLNCLVMGDLLHDADTLNDWNNTIAQLSNEEGTSFKTIEAIWIVSGLFVALPAAIAAFISKRIDR